MSKQDRQGVRTAAEVEQKYGLGQFMYDQKQKNQDLSKGISNLGDSFSNYKTENEERLSDMSDSFNETINGFSKEIEDLTKGIFNMIYPVGSIYISVSENNPSTLFGGTWERIEDRFLLAAGSSYSVGATGGEATHTLSENEMPRHQHALDMYLEGWGTTVEKVTNSLPYGRYTNIDVKTAYQYNSGTYKGGGEAHNNMPPYLAVYVWKRTA